MSHLIPVNLANQAVAECEKVIAELKAENERLRASSFVTAVPSEEYEKLKAENERLREAGDAMYDFAVQDSMGIWVMPPFDKWSKEFHSKNNAKGVQS